MALVKSKGLTKKDKKANKEMALAIKEGAVGPWADPDLTKTKDIHDVMNLLSLDPISISGLEKNKFNFYTTKTDISLSDQNLVISVPFDKAISEMVKSRNPRPFVTVNKFCMLWFGLRGCDDGAVDLAIIDESVKDVSKSVEMAWRGRAGGQWGCIGGMNHYIAREDCHHLKLYLRVTGSDIQDAVISRVLFLWGIEETDIPIQTRAQEHYLTNFTPAEPKSYANLKSFKQLAKLLVGETIDKITPTSNDIRGEGTTVASSSTGPALSSYYSPVVEERTEFPTSSAPPYDSVVKDLQLINASPNSHQAEGVVTTTDFCRALREIRTRKK